MNPNPDSNEKPYQGRSIEISDLVGEISKPMHSGSRKLDIVKLLRGTWVSRDEGWNLIALPASPKIFKNGPATRPDSFRLLMNQYGETLKFNMPDTGVPNRGITTALGVSDQFIDGITYEQFVVQRAASDFPESIDGVRAKFNEPIHHEPGFFLQLLNHVDHGTSPDVGAGKEPKALEIARMGTIPHGNSVLAMGFVTHDKKIEDDNAFPERLKKGDLTKSDFVSEGLKHYLQPYQHFIDSPFFGCVDPKRLVGFPGFSPANTHAILQFTQKGLKVKRTTALNFDTKFKVAGVDDAKFDENDKPISGFPISNVSFVKRQASVTEMHATFWIMELEKTDTSIDSMPEFVMQYSQTVYLEFFDSPVDMDENGKARRIRWPHVSINTLRKVDPLG